MIEPNVFLDRLRAIEIQIEVANERTTLEQFAGVEALYTSSRRAVILRQADLFKRCLDAKAFVCISGDITYMKKPDRSWQDPTKETRELFVFGPSLEEALQSMKEELDSSDALTIRSI